MILIVVQYNRFYHNACIFFLLCLSGGKILSCYLHPTQLCFEISIMWQYEYAINFFLVKHLAHLYQNFLIKEKVEMLQCLNKFDTFTMLLKRLKFTCKLNATEYVCIFLESSINVAGFLLFHRINFHFPHIENSWLLQLLSFGQFMQIHIIFLGKI